MQINRLFAIAGLIGATSVGNVSASTVYGLTSNNALVMFDSTTPGAIIGSVSVSGLSNGQVIRGIDFRPADGGLYGVSSDSRLYTINTATGAATAIGGAHRRKNRGGRRFALVTADPSGINERSRSA